MWFLSLQLPIVIDPFLRLSMVHANQRQHQQNKTIFKIDKAYFLIFEQMFSLPI